MSEDTPILSSTQMFTRKTSFRRYKVYADIRLGSRVRMRRLTVGLVESDQFSIPLVALSSEPLKTRQQLSQKLTT